MWYSIVTFGAAEQPTPARGPFHTFEEAQAAIGRFRERYGADAGTYLNAQSARIVGPFATRREARDADISTATPCDPMTTT